MYHGVSRTTSVFSSGGPFVQLALLSALPALAVVATSNAVCGLSTRGTLACSDPTAASVLPAGGPFVQLVSEPHTACCALQEDGVARCSMLAEGDSAGVANFTSADRRYRHMCMSTAHICKCSAAVAMWIIV